MDLAKETKGLIHNVLTSSKQTLTIRKLNSEYRQLVGYYIPFSKLGFPTLELYLRSLPDILQIHGQDDLAEVHVIVSEKSAHVRELISKQKDPKKSAARDSRKGTFTSTKPQYCDRNATSNNHRLNAINQTFLPNQVNSFFQKEMVPPIAERSHGFNQQIPYTLRLPFIPEGFNQNFPHSSSYVYDQYRPNRPVATPSYNISGPNNYRPTTSKNHSAHESQSSKVPSSSSIIDSSFNVTSKSNNSKTGDFKPQEELQRKGTCTNLDVKEADLSGDEIYFSDEEQLNAKVPQVIQDNLHSLISKYPEGIWCSKIPDAYKKQFGMDLNYTDYGYMSLSQMCADMGNSFKCVQLKQGDYKIFDKLSPVNPNLQNVTKRHEHLKPMNNSTTPGQLALPQDDIEDLLSNIYKISIPSDIVEFGEFIERQWINPSITAMSYLDINVGEVYDPSKFWLNLGEFGNQLNMLMDDMQSFYTMNSKAYRAPHFALKTGLYVAAVFSQEYHRALIVDIMNVQSDLVKLFFIDYGTVAVINTSGVCYLCKRFSQLPAQGIRARLAGIRPLVQNERWSQKAAQKFLSLVSDKDLVAQVINIDEQKEILDVILTDVRGEEDFFINDALVSEGLAVFSQSQAASNQIDNFVHLYPTFSELENGSSWTENQISIWKQTNNFSANKKQGLCSRCAKEIEIGKELVSTESSTIGNVKHVGVQTVYCNVEQTQNEPVILIPPPLLPDVDHIVPIFEDMKQIENYLNLNNHSMAMVNANIPLTSNVNFQNTFHNTSVIPLSSNLNPSATPFHPTHTKSLVPFPQNEIIYNGHSSFLNNPVNCLSTSSNNAVNLPSICTSSNTAVNFPIPSASSNNAVNFPICGDPFRNENRTLNEIHPLNAFQNQPTCTIEFSTLQSETVQIVPLLHQTAVQLQNGTGTVNAKMETNSVIKKCHVRVKDSFKFVTNTVLQDGIIHVIAYNNEDYFLVDEIVYGLFGQTLSILQIGKMFIGTPNMIPAFISINLNKLVSLKQALLECNLIQESTVCVNAAPVSSLLCFVTFLTKMPKPYVCN